MPCAAGAPDGAAADRLAAVSRVPGAHRGSAEQECDIRRGAQPAHAASGVWDQVASVIHLLLSITLFYTCVDVQQCQYTSLK